MLLPMAGVAAQAAVAVAADPVAAAVRVEMAGPQDMEAARWEALRWAARREQAPPVLTAQAMGQ
ncbi:MAG: hypothetical protein JO271_00100 [Verrucomicrobia bacterium]|nr:hypothetical protein [Verrucomicrobiota bacterium]